MDDTSGVTLKSDSATIMAEVAARQISQLVHFTPSINLVNVFSTGFVLSRQQLEQQAIHAPDMHLNDYLETNDQLRLDQRRDHINLSIQMPNAFLLRRFRALPHFCDDWCVLAMEPSCLALQETLFSVTNAASAASRRYGITGDHAGFTRMFAETLTVGSISTPRVVSRNGLRPCYATDVQAEVLVFQRIPVSMILRACFESDRAAKQALHALRVNGLSPACPFVCEPSLFQPQRS